MIYIPKNKRRVLFEKTNGKEDLFLFLMEGTVSKIDEKEYPDYIFLFKGDKILFDFYKIQDEKNGHFWCSYQHYWSVFENEYGLNYTEVQEFTKDMVEKHFKMKVLTPSKAEDWKLFLVEKHFKMKVLTPQEANMGIRLGVEKHFKMKVLTPSIAFYPCFFKVEKHFKMKVLTPPSIQLNPIFLVEKHFKTKVETSICQKSSVPE